MMKKLFPFLSILAIGLFFFGLIYSDPFGSRTNNSNDNAINPVVPQTNAVVKYVDSLNGANDTIALRTRGYIPKRGPGSGPAGTSPNWFQGNSGVFPAFEGPTTGYVAANFNNVTGTNNIDLWLISPPVNGNSGDTLSFYERSPLNSTFPDSIRVYWASNGDTVPGSGSFVELGRFKTNTTAWGERRFTLPSAGATGRFAINYRVVGGGPSGLNSDFIGIDFIRLLGPAAPSGCTVPELMYFRFENNSPTTTPNTASAPVGTVNAPYTGPISSGGMWDSCALGTGATGTTGVLPGWNCNLAASSWTIGFFVKDLVEVTAGNPVYLFGDPGSTAFRCFYGGFALPNNAIIRGPFADVIFPCPMPGSHYFHIVYNGTNLIIYRNGVQVSSTPMAINMPTGSGFRVAGYTGGAFGLNAGGRLDEFRLYNRALSAGDITASWNKSELPACLVGITQTNNEVPSKFTLSQNYPNPFNPTTNIKFAIPSTGLVKLVVFDVLGREVKTLVNEVKVAGNYTVDFNASELSSGVYFYKIEAGNFTQTKKMLLVK